MAARSEFRDSSGASGCGGGFAPFDVEVRYRGGGGEKLRYVVRRQSKPVTAEACVEELRRHAGREAVASDYDVEVAFEGERARCVAGDQLLRRSCTLHVWEAVADPDAEFVVVLTDESRGAVASPPDFAYATVKGLFVPTLGGGDAAGVAVLNLLDDLVPFNVCEDEVVAVRVATERCYDRRDGALRTFEADGRTLGQAAARLEPQCTAFDVMRVGRRKRRVHLVHVAIARERLASLHDQACQIHCCVQVTAMPASLTMILFVEADEVDGLLRGMTVQDLVCLIVARNRHRVTRRHLARFDSPSSAERLVDLVEKDCCSVSGRVEEPGAGWSRVLYFDTKAREAALAPRPIDGVGPRIVRFDVKVADNRFISVGSLRPPPLECATPMQLNDLDVPCEAPTVAILVEDGATGEILLARSLSLTEAGSWFSVREVSTIALSEAEKDNPGLSTEDAPWVAYHSSDARLTAARWPELEALVHRGFPSRRAPGGMWRTAPDEGDQLGTLFDRRGDFFGDEDPRPCRGVLLLSVGPVAWADVDFLLYLDLSPHGSHEIVASVARRDVAASESVKALLIAVFRNYATYRRSGKPALRADSTSLQLECSRRPRSRARIHAPRDDRSSRTERH